MNHALQIFKIFEKRGHSHFPHKNGGVGKISLMFILTNPLQCYLSLSVWCVCVCMCMCVLFIYTISIGIVFHRKNDDGELSLRYV